MFFIGVFGIDQAEKEIGQYQRLLCPVCGSWTQLTVVKSYTYFHIFFIPTFRWNIHFYAKAACCGTVFELEPGVGQAFARGEEPEIRAEHLTPLGHGTASLTTCPNCGRSVEPTAASGYQFCPYCGHSLRR